MNLRIRKIVTLLVLLFTVVLISGCGEAKRPEISNPDANYLTAEQGSLTYKLTNKKVYDVLKKQVGQNSLLDIVDKDILKGTKIWDKVSAEDIQKEIEQSIFSDTKEKFIESLRKDGKTEEEITTEVKEKEDDFYDQSFLEYGLNNKEEVNEYYHLVLARKKYAYEEAVKEVEKEDFKSGEYESYYKANYAKEYYALIFNFKSVALYTEALSQLGLKLENGVWKTSAGVNLSKQQIIKAFIDLYNLNNSYKVPGYPEKVLMLNKDVEYTVNANGEYTFNLEKIDFLHYTYAEIRKYQSQIQALLDKMDAYDKGDNFYSEPLDYTNGRYSFVLKIALNEPKTESEVKAEIKEKLLQNKLTDSYIQGKMVALRQESELVIYDKDLESKYVEFAKNYKVDHKVVKKLKGNLVAATKYAEIDADSFFKFMNASYGISLSTYELEYAMLLNNPLYNTIYKMDSSLKEDDRIIDKTKYTSIKNQIADIKANFKNNVYEQYGFGKNYGWEKFLKDAYNANSEEELLANLLYQSIKESFGTNLGKLITENELWDFYKYNMEEMVKAYYNVEGIHLLISVDNEDGGKVDPKKWTAAQLSGAKEFYNEVMEYIKTDFTKEEKDKFGNDFTEKAGYKARFDKLVKAFEKAPRFVPSLPQNSVDQPTGFTYTFEGIEISKYKTLGLNIKFEDLGTFTNGKMVKEFDEAVKEIWDKDPKADKAVIYGVEKEEGEEYKEIKTTFGFHLYINIKSSPIAEWDDKKVLPTFDQITKYVINQSDKTLTSKMKTAITTYYSPINSELIGTNNVGLQINKLLKDTKVTFGHSDYDSSEFNRYINLMIKGFEEKLKYKVSE